MELVYLWVEDYKNIKRQGFNFSPRFECEFYPEYDEDGNLTENSKLEIKEKEYVKIFPENINITAIVGKNGSGKSSVLEILANNNNENKLYVYNNGLCKETNLDTYILYIKKSNLKEFEFYKKFKQVMLEDEKIFIFINKNFIYDKYFLYIKDLNISSKKIEDKEKLFWELLLKSLKHYTAIIEPGTELGNLLQDVNDYELEKKYNKLLKNLTKLNNDEIEREYHNIVNIINRKYKNISKIPKFSRKEIINLSKKFKYDKYQKIYKTENLNFSKKLEFSDDKLYLYLQQEELIKENYINSMNDLVIDYQNLSDGEKRLINIFTNLFYEILVYNKNKIKVILFDEPDTHLHPQWQKELFFLILKGCKKLKLKDFYLIFSTHSPFLLSDIPNQNIIFLHTDEKGNCKVVNGLKDKKQTFGANIHTLLSDSFFMENGLMGEFAKSKINEIKDFYNFVLRVKKIIKKNNIQKRLEKLYLKKKENFWQIQKIIGEPFLQKIVKNQLEEIETILFEEKAKEIAIKRFISEFGEEAISKVLNNDKN